MPPSDRRVDRRDLLGVARGATLLCTIGGRQMAVSSPEDVAKVDAEASKARRPKAKSRRRRDPVDDAQFPITKPQPGGALPRPARAAPAGEAWPTLKSMQRSRHMRRNATLTTAVIAGAALALGGATAVR